ncbi:MAG: sugar phosphate isomerase/epimerase [Cyclobacteriaceae bacterium]|nr:sugar phosphate isomerase/epimerase [Cyclobacteriaceae bacterium]
MISRRSFHKKTLGVAGLTWISGRIHGKSIIPQNKSIRLGGPLFDKFNDPDEWIVALKKLGYRAAYCPISHPANDELIKGYRDAAKKADIIIAEVGAWSNPISPSHETAQKALEKCIDALALADAIEAKCCVNIAGSKNPVHWAGPHPDNFTDSTFDEIVEVTQKIIDAVKPKKTFFTLEAMPWVFPDNPDTYLRLIKAIDRKQFGVHLDPMNMVVSPRTYFYNGDLIRECFQKLGPHIKSCHGKDIIMAEDAYTPQLNECRPGLGKLNYAVFLEELAKLNDIPLMTEHLPNAEEYNLAAAYIRDIGNKLGIAL